MGNSKNSIEINGVRYDASTGKKLGGSSTSKKSVPGVAIDGVVRSKSVKSRQAHVKANKSNAHHKKVQKAQTLKRTGLKKPNANTQGISDSKIASKDVAYVARLKKARSISRSKQISRFTRVGTFTKSVTQMDVALPSRSNIKLKSATAQNVKRAEPTLESFEKAIEDASTHLNKYVSKKKRKVFRSKKINALAGSLAILLLVGFFGYQNANKIEMRVASTKAGFSAHLPGYNPAGFSLAGPIESEPGKVAVSFKSRTDDRQYKITQVASNWSSETLENQLGEKNDKQVWQEQGKTVYTYDNSNASWVDGGVLYKIEGNSQLNSDQLRRIVNSF